VKTKPKHKKRKFLAGAWNDNLNLNLQNKDLLFDQIVWEIGSAKQSRFISFVITLFYMLWFIICITYFSITSFSHSMITEIVFPLSLVMIAFIMIQNIN
jgi:hypothetical protein